VNADQGAVTPIVAMNCLEVKQLAETFSIIEVATRCGIFRSFTNLLAGSPLEQELNGEATYTLFAPADIAFAYLSPETITRLLHAENQGILADVLGYHVVPDKFVATELRDLSRLKTTYGEDLNITNTLELRIEGARLLQTDIAARNGVIHVIDRLLLPVERAATTSA